MDAKKGAVIGILGLVIAGGGVLALWPQEGAILDESNTATSPATVFGEPDQPSKVEATKNNNSDTAVHAPPNLRGVWNSTGDIAYAREFKMNGTLVDKYKSAPDEKVIAKWRLMNPSQSNNVESKEIIPGTTVIRVEFAVGNTMYLGITSLSETELVLTNLSGRGQMLKYTRGK